MNYIETMKQALEALTNPAMGYEEHFSAITSLRAAIDAAEKQEPVGLFVQGDRGWYETDCGNGEPLFSHPAPTQPESKHWKEAAESLGAECDALKARLLDMWAERTTCAPTQPDSEQAKDAERDELVAALTKIGEIASPYRDGVKFNYIADIAQAALAKVGAGGTADVPETSFGDMAQAVDSSGSPHADGAEVKS